MLLRSIGAFLRSLSVSLLLLSCGFLPARADTPAPHSSPNKGQAAAATSFNVPGPLLQVNVRRGEESLPIYQVPSLQPGDILSVTSSFKEKEPVHWMLVSGFLRGATEPPPEKWFSEVDLWKHHNWDRAQQITVPSGANQGLLFLAPDSGGGFSTLKNTVRRQPNLFLRVSQDMTRATAEQGRMNSFLNGMRSASPMGNPQTATQRSIALANSLSINVNGKCFDANQQQTPCLVQNTDQLLADSNTRGTAVQNLTSMPSANLIGGVISSQLGAAFFPYVGAAIDVIHLLGGARTADYQYLPALAERHGDRIRLKLNHDPTFKSPKSVLVYVLPQVEPMTPPSIVVDTENHPTCISSAASALPAEAPPALYSTQYGHDWILSLKDADGRTQNNISIKADPSVGGFLVSAGAVNQNLFKNDTSLQGTITGRWGFKTVTLPPLTLEHPRSGAWQLNAQQHESLIAGSKVALNLSSPVAACIGQIQLNDGKGHHLAAVVTHTSATTITAAFDLSQAVVSEGSLQVQQAGLSQPDQQKLRIYQPLPRVDKATYYAGDHVIELAGQRLDEIASAEFGGAQFDPAHLPKSTDTPDTVQLIQPDSAPATTLAANSNATAVLHLRDGRSMNLSFPVQAPRPLVKILSLNPRNPVSTIQLQNHDAVPQDTEINLTLQSVTPAAFQPDEKIQIHSDLQTTPVELSLSHGLMLQDQQTVIASFVPAQLLGASTFGRLEFRAIDARGVAGAWQALPKVVRLPQLKEIRCPLSLNSKCTLTGDHLYLLAAISAEPSMKHAVKIPGGFTGASVEIPRPSGSTIFIQLRDDPDTADPVLLPVLPELPSASGQQ